MRSRTVGKGGKEEAQKTPETEHEKVGLSVSWLNAVEADRERGLAKDTTHRDPLDSLSVSQHRSQVARLSGHTHSTGCCCHLGDSADPEPRLRPGRLSHSLHIPCLPLVSGVERGGQALFCNGEGSEAERTVPPLVWEL